MHETVEVKLGCDNCGHIAMYTIPVRRVVKDHGYDEITERHECSEYHRVNGSDSTPIFCKSCKLPYLKVMWWDVKTDTELVREGIDGSTDSRNAG